MPEIGLFEAIYSARSLRRLKPDPVPEELITKILDAAIRAPSGGNAQNWAFVVVRDPEQRQKLGAIYRKASGIAEAMYAARGRPPHLTEQQFARMMGAGAHLWQHMGEAPVLLLPCGRRPALPPPEALPPISPSAGRTRSPTRPHPRRQHLPGRAERHPRLSCSRPRHGHHHQPHPLRSRGQRSARHPRGYCNVCADADRLAARQIRPFDPPPARRSGPRRPLGSRLARLICSSPANRSKPKVKAWRFSLCRAVFVRYEHNRNIGPLLKWI